MFINEYLYRCILLIGLISVYSHTSFGQTIQHGVILQYHHVNSHTPAVTSISPQKFEEHLELIESQGFQVLPLETMINQIKLGVAFKSNTLAITFDDNYRSIYENAFPLLKQRGWPFTIFVNPKDIKSSNNGFILSWDELKEMKHNGATIANHTQSHWHLLKREKNESKKAWQDRIKQDIQAAQHKLEAKLGKTPKWLAYPYGEFNEDLKKLTQSMGYLGFSQQSGPINHTTNWQSIPRFPASGVYANMVTLKTKLNSQAFEIYSEKPFNTVRKVGDQAPTLELIINKHNIRHTQLNCFFAGKKIYSEVRMTDTTLIINAQYEGKLPFGRSRYNCTAPAINGGYYWYSMPFVATNENDQWQD